MGPVYAAVQTGVASRPTVAGARSWSKTKSWTHLGHGRAWPWLVALLALVSVPLVDGLFGDVVAFERDTTVFYYPLMKWVGQRLHQGDFPLWTPQIFGGYPIFADGEIGLAYPPALLALLLLPADAALIGLRLVHLWIAALGMFALARAWRLPYPSATLAGVVFALGSFLAAQIHHENIIRTASWLPMLLATVEHALCAASSRARWRWTLLAAIVLGLAGLSLHSQMLAIDLMILAAYGGFRWAIGPLPTGLVKSHVWLDRLAHVSLVCVPVVLIGVGLAAVQLVPLVELAGFSARGSGIPYSESAAYSLTPYGLAQLIFPYVFRGINNQQWGLWTHWESYLYIGIAPLVLVSVALVCVRRREVAGWGILALLGLILSIGQYSPINLHYLLWLLPGLSGLRAPGRFTVIVILAAAMLAAYGLAWLYQSGADRGRLRRLLNWWWVALAGMVVLGAAIHLGLLAWPSQSAAAIEFAYLSLSRDSYTLTSTMVRNGLLWSTDILNPNVYAQVATLAVVLLVVRTIARARNRARSVWTAALVGIAAIDLLAFGWMIHPREPIARLGAEPPAIQVIDAQPSPDAAPNRILASPVLNQIAADRLAPFGLQEAGGYSSLQFIWHRDYLGRVLYADDGLLDLWNVRYILDPAKYGQLSSYKGVNFLTSQALLQAPGGSALGDQTFNVASSAPITELRLVTALVGAVDVPQGATVGTIELRDAAGNITGTADLVAGRDTMDWASDTPGVQPYVQHQRAEVAGTATENGSSPGTRQLSFAAFTFSQPVSATQLVVRATPPNGELVLYGAALVDSNGAATQLFGRTKSKFRQVYVDDDIRVLEDTAALPRAFVVPTAREAPSLGAALSEMIHRPFQPASEVVLAKDAASDAAGPLERGGIGSARVDTYTPETVDVHTSASSDAWLVLSDTYYPGWSASVDGQTVPILRGDVLFRVVPIPAGDHEVTFHFNPPSVRLGLAISIACLVFVLCGLAAAGAHRRVTRTT